MQSLSVTHPMAWVNRAAAVAGDVDEKVFLYLVSMVKLPTGDKPSQPYRCESESPPVSTFHTPQPQQIGWMDATDVGGFSVRAQEFDSRLRQRRKGDRQVVPR